MDLLCTLFCGALSLCGSQFLVAWGNIRSLSHINWVDFIVPSAQYWLWRRPCCGHGNRLFVIPSREAHDRWHVIWTSQTQRGAISSGVPQNSGTCWLLIFLKAKAKFRSHSQSLSTSSDIQQQKIVNTRFHPTYVGQNLSLTTKLPTSDRSLFWPFQWWSMFSGLWEHAASRVQHAGTHKFHMLAASCHTIVEPVYEDHSSK